MEHSDGTKTLFSLFQKLDFRDKENSGKKKLAGILIAYLFSNSVMAYNFSSSFDERSFIILALTSNLFLLSLIVLTDFDNLFLAARSSDLLRTLPVKSSVIFRAKFISAVIFLFMFIVCASLPHVIFFHFYGNDFLKTVSFFATDIVFCYFAMGILILIYIFTLSYFKSKATIILNILQIFFFVFVFYSSTLSSRVRSVPGEDFVKGSILNFGIVKYLPQTFFSMSVYSIFYFMICAVITLSVFSLVFLIMSKKYYSILDTVKGFTVKKRSKPKIDLAFINTFINKYLLSNNYERASFDLVKNELKNSRFLRVKYMPMIFMPVVFVLIGMISDSPHLLIFNKGASAASFFRTEILIISPSITFTLLMCARILISNTKILDDNSAGTGWIYDSLPVKENRFVISGANKFVYIFFIIPVMFLILLLVSMKADFSVVSLNMIFIFTGIYFINSIALLFDKTLPFTLESSKFNSASKFIEIFLAIILGMILFLIQIFVFQNIIFVIIAVAVFISIPLLLNRI